MARRTWGISSLVIAALVALSVLLAWTATASAAAPPATQATDPNANTPAGVIYSIPLDNARQDAAPHGHHNGSSGTGIVGGGSGGGGGTGGGTSGGTGGSGPSSSGGSGGSGGTGVASTASGPANNPAVLVPGGQPSSLVHSSNGFGSSSSVPGLNAPASAGFRAVQNDASDAPLFAILLAAVVLALGAFVGSRSWRASRMHPSR